VNFQRVPVEPVPLTPCFITMPSIVPKKEIEMLDVFREGARVHSRSTSPDLSMLSKLGKRRVLPMLGCRRAAYRDSSL
jgi:hypothetical protein